MPVEYRKRITRQMLQTERDKIFVFGDNLERRGMGGQAYEMRGEPNAVGIPTKHKPDNSKDAFFDDSQMHYTLPEIAKSFATIYRFINNGGTVVWPSDNIGTGRADLPNKAPTTFAFIEALRRGLNDEP